MYAGARFGNSGMIRQLGGRFKNALKVNKTLWLSAVSTSCYRLKMMTEKGGGVEQSPKAPQLPSRKRSFLTRSNFKPRAKFTKSKRSSKTCRLRVWFFEFFFMEPQPSNNELMQPFDLAKCSTIPLLCRVF